MLNRIIVLIFLLIISLSCKAQTVRHLHDYTDDIGKNMNGNYYQDIDGHLTNIAGTWQYQSNDTLLTLNLRITKDTISSLGETYFMDTVVGEYTLEIDGAEVLNTNNFSSFVSPTGNNISLESITVYDASDNLVRYAVWLYDPRRPYVYWNINAYYEESLIMGQGMVETLRWEFKYSELYDYPPNIDQSYFLPSVIEFTR